MLGYTYPESSPFYSPPPIEQARNPYKDRSLKGKQRKKARREQNAQVRKYLNASKEK